MEKNYEITKKQLSFLEGFLDRKHPHISRETKVELIDHLISDFEATTENGNLSQYLSNELEFIRKFVFNGVSEVKKTYRKETWGKFFSFFANAKMLPISIFIISLFYFLNELLSLQIFWITIMIIQTIIFGFSVFIGSIKNKNLKYLDEVKFLGAEIWLPFALVQLFAQKEITNFIMFHNLISTIFSSFIIIYALAAFLVLREKKKIILEKYKDLLS